MKFFKGVFLLPIATGLMIVLTSSADSLTCNLNLIRDGSFEDSASADCCEDMSTRAGNGFTNVPEEHHQTVGDMPQLWYIRPVGGVRGNGIIDKGGTVTVIPNRGTPNRAHEKPPPPRDPNDPKLPSEPTQVFNTPDGFQFLALGFNIGIREATVTRITQVKQDIRCTLDPAKNPYTLSFLMSPFANGDPAGGHVRVKLGLQGISTDDQIFDFTVGPTDLWIQKIKQINITTRGSYYIEFSSIEEDGKFPAANIDAVSLCEKQP